MSQNQEVVIGIDGGGTHTRVMVSDLDGNVLSYVETGSAWVKKDLQAKQNLNLAVVEALAAAGKERNQVRALAAGIAGYDSEADLEWTEGLTAVDGLNCPKWHFNDAVAAHYGALLTKPGIVALSGTGAIVMALTEDGQYIRDYDFHHYTGSGARYIAYGAVYEVLAGNTDETDAELITLMLEHWNVGTVHELSNLGKSGFDGERRARDRKFGQFTPFITEAASKGSTLARRVNDRAIHQLKVGIELLAPFFSSETVPVAFTGSVINSGYFYAQLSALLTHGNNKQFTVVKPRFSPVTGSVLYAINQVPGHSIHEGLIRNLEQSPHTEA